MPACRQNTTYPPNISQGAHEYSRWHPKFQAATKINAGSPPKEMPGGHQNKGWLPTKMAVVHDNATCPTKKMVGAHLDARYPPKCHMPTKTKSESEPRCWCSPK